MTWLMKNTSLVHSDKQDLSKTFCFLLNRTQSPTWKVGFCCLVATLFTRLNKKRWTAQTKSVCVASPILHSPCKSPCFPTKEPGIEKAHNTNQRSHSCNAGTLSGLWSTLPWKTVQGVTLNCPVLGSKGKNTVTLMVFFLIFEFPEQTGCFWWF